VTTEAHQIIPTILISLAVLWSLTQGFGILMDKFKLPRVLGELLCGIFLSAILLELNSFGLTENLLGSFLQNSISFIQASDVLFALGEIGIILLLFEIGLETELDQIVSVGKEATFVAIGGVVCPFVFCYIFAYFFNRAFPAQAWSSNLTLFAGLVLAATSIGVTARVFKDLNKLHLPEAKIVLGAAVIDDVIGLMMLSVISTLVSTNSFSLGIVCLTVVKSLVFLLGSIFVGRKVSNALIGQSYKQSNPLDLMVCVLAFCFLMAYLANLAGLAPIVGAFAAGLALDAVKLKGAFGETKSIEDFTAPIRSILAPIFFVKVGLSIQLESIFSALPFALTLIACFSKLVSGYVLPLKTKLNRLVIGIGMMPRGEVGLVVASIGFGLKILPSHIYSALVFAVVMTTLIAPILLQKLLAKQLTSQSEKNKAS
jgi:Kef-type K+ transport system membrane component KefB